MENKNRYDFVNDNEFLMLTSKGDAMGIVDQVSKLEFTGDEEETLSAKQAVLKLMVVGNLTMDQAVNIVNGIVNLKGSDYFVYNGLLDKSLYDESSKPTMANIWFKALVDYNDMMDSNLSEEILDGLDNLFEYVFKFGTLSVLDEILPLFTGNVIAVVPEEELDTFEGCSLSEEQEAIQKYIDSL